jgi:hypothetical protein
LFGGLMWQRQFASDARKALRNTIGADITDVLRNANGYFTLA